MKSRTHVLSLMLVAICSAPLAAQNVTLAISSPQDGATVEAGATINWSIDFEVTPFENVGLALLCVDLVQSPENPELLDLPPADGVPAEMINFSRPAGISNPGDGDGATGYVGVQRGAPGAKNLRQIGGSQNTFGQALPTGSGVAESANIAPAIGQNGSVTLASGSFTAPSTPGAYTFQLENAFGHVLLEVNAPPEHSRVIQVTVVVASASISFSVGGEICEPCDVNCDGASDGRDIQAFVDTLLLGVPASCSPCAGDINGGDGVTFEDVEHFLGCLLDD